MAADSSQPPQVNATQLMLTAMSDLTRTLQALDEHTQEVDAAAQRRAAAVANADSVTARSQGLDASVPDNWMAQATLLRAQTAQNQLQEQASGQSTSTPPKNTPEDPTNPSDAEALTFAMLGQHGGPFGALRMQQYMLNRNIAWGANVAGSAGTALQNYASGSSGVLGNLAGGAAQMLGSKDEEGNATGGLSSLLGWAQTPAGQWTSMGALGTMRGGEQLINAVTNWGAAGRDLGYGTSSNLGILGFRNPLSQLDASKEGVSLGLEKQALEGRVPGMGMGSGLTGAAATEAVGTLASQGFSNQSSIGSPFGNMVSGDNYNIASNLMRPLMNMGLAPQDVAQWTPALRNASTSIQQLRDTLDAIPNAAKAAKETVGTLNSELVSLGEQTMQNGGLMGQGAETGMAWEAGTGLNPATAGPLMNNPIYQGMMMGQYGVLPSGIADLPGGAQAGGMMSMFNLLRHATSGLNQTKFETLPDGKRVPIANGWQLQDSQIAEMMGISQNQVNRLRNESRTAGTVNSTLSRIGSPTDQTGLFAKGLSSNERQANWKDLVDGHASQLGLSHAQVKSMDGMSNLHDRYKALEDDLLGQRSKSSQNKVKVEISLKGNANKFFKANVIANMSANSPLLHQNAGGPAANSVINSPGWEAALAKAGGGI